MLPSDRYMMVGTEVAKIMNKPSGNRLVSCTPVALEMCHMLAADIETVQEIFVRELTSDLPLVNERIEHLGKFRGKMLRPRLVLLCGRFWKPIGPRHHTVATAVEMLHMAALIHDDVLDQSRIRRRGPTLNSLYGNETAVLTGDFLLSHVFKLCSKLACQKLSYIIAETAGIVCEGEIMQLAHTQDWELTEQKYFQIISNKTASLCGASCRLGVECSEGPAGLARSLDEYGYNLGLAFQITDDLLDLTGTEAVVGKPLRQDIVQGKLTLPAIRTRDILARAAREEFMHLLRQGRAENVDRIGQVMAECGALASVSETAREYADKAVDKLAILPNGTERMALEKIAQFIVERRI